VPCFIQCSLPASPQPKASNSKNAFLGRATFFCGLLLVLALVVTHPAEAQTLTVLHTFTGPDGLAPYSGVTMDHAGNLYGTTYGGGASGLGTVYELKRHGSGYLHNELHAFTDANGDGEQPYGGVIFGPDGGLYETTFDGGIENGGIVFSLRPPLSFCRTVLCPWTEPLKFELAPTNNVANFYGNVAFDQAGNLYGTTGFGGISEYGTVYELSRSGNGWTGSAIYKFQADDLQYPGHNVIVDSSGNLYGTASGGALGEGECSSCRTPVRAGWKPLSPTSVRPVHARAATPYRESSWMVRGICSEPRPATARQRASTNCRPPEVLGR
jgi:uncharacterized repeat protein (TIGR03803 family)